MGFYDEIAKNINWEYTSNTDAYLKVVNNKLQLPHPGWLQYHLRFLDKVIESIHAFEKGQLRYEPYDIDKIKKHVFMNPGEAINFLRNISAKHKIFSIDIESDNLSTDKTKNSLLCIGIAWADDEAASFNETCFESPVFKSLFREFLLNKDFTFILHNGIFDKSRTQLLADMQLKIDEDTMLKHYCGINEHKGTHKLKDLAQLYLKFPDWEAPLDEWKRQFCRSNKIKLKEFGYHMFPRQTLCEYNCIDVCATFQLNKVFDVLMRPETVDIYRKLIEASEHYANMIVRGMKLNYDYWFVLRDKLEAEIHQLEDNLSKIIPGVNVSSPIQLKSVLQERFKYDAVDSTDKKSLETLSSKYPGDELLQMILDYRKASKYLKTYVYGIWDKKDAEGIIHCEYKLHGTETGRLSSSNPNMQNIPRNSLIKSLFIAREGYTLLQLDYSQAELRVLAYISGDEKLIQCYIDGRDLHTEIQKHLFGDLYDEGNADQRNIAKTINFGIPYGRTAGGIASNLRISMREAKQYLSDWFKGAPSVKDYIEKCHIMALSNPQDIWVTPFGRSRRYYVTSESVYHVKNQSVNFPISSTANDLTIYSLIEIGNWLREQKLDAYFVNTVHDSIIIECREKDAKMIASKCQEIMSEIPVKYLPNLTVPFKADAEVGRCYGDLKEPDWGGEDEDEDE